MIPTVTLDELDKYLTVGDIVTVAGMLDQQRRLIEYVVGQASRRGMEVQAEG
jgi:hypothetical protein